MQENDNQKPLMVTIRCTAYNHEPYIRECLEGFVMQKTNFIFEAIVHDDASTDGTAAIIREYAEKYPDIIKPIFETENQYSKHDGSLRRIMDEHTHGKYVALCEGDDYWIDPLKLQKQVDYMEAHPECSMCHTSLKYYYEREDRFFLSKDVKINPQYKTLKLEDVLDGYRIQTLTLLTRKEHLFKIREMDPFVFSGKFLMGDTQTWYYLRKLGDFHFIPDVTSIYRVHIGSASRKNYKGQLRFEVSCAELRYYLCNKDHLDSNYSLDIRKRLKMVLSLYRCFEPDYQTIIPSLQYLPKESRNSLYTAIRKNEYIFISLLKKRIGKIVRKFKKYN